MRKLYVIQLNNTSTVSCSTILSILKSRTQGTWLPFWQPWGCQVSRNCRNKTSSFISERWFLKGLALNYVYGSRGISAMNADTKPLVWKYAKKYCKSNVFLYISVNTKVSNPSYMISLFDNPEDTKSRRYCGNKTKFFASFHKNLTFERETDPEIEKEL